MNTLNFSLNTAFVGPFGSSGGEVGLILFIFLLLFGAKKLPEMARTMGRYMEHLRRASNEFKGQLMEADKSFKAATSDITDSTKDLSMSGSTKDAGWSSPDDSPYSDDPWAPIDYDDANLEDTAAKVAPDKAPVSPSPDTPSEDENRAV